MTTSLPTPRLRLTPASDTGVSHSDGITDDTVPVIAGTATPGALVTITDANSGLSVTTRADKYGNYVAMLAGLEAGIHGLTASATDANGNVSPTSNPLAIDIETTATATSTPALNPDTSESVTFAVHFNQPVSAVTPASFMLATTGDAYGNVEFVAGSGQDYNVTVAGLGGSGSVALAFSGDAPTDVAGNEVALSSALHEVSDTTVGVTTTVSADKSGVQGTGAGPSPTFIGGGVAFISDDPDLVPGGQTTAGVSNVYVKRLDNGTILQVTNGNDQTLNVETKDNNVAFSSRATNLVPGGTPAGQLNLYVAELNVASHGLSLIPGSIQLVGALNPEVYLADEVGFALSGDGDTLAYEGDTTLADGTTDAPGEFIYNLNTGVTTQFQFAAPGDGTSLYSGNITSISTDGTRIAYEASVPVPGTGGQANIYTGGTVPPNLIQDAFVYDTISKTTFTIDGSGLLPGTTPPTGEDQTPSYLTQYPVLSGDGSTVVFQVERVGQYSGVSLFSVNLANPSVFSPVSPVASSGDGTEDDFGQNVSQTGAVIAYTSEDPTTGPRIRVYTPATGTTTDLGVGYQAVLDRVGDAIVYDEPTDETGSQAIIYEQTLGVSASIAPIDGDDAINAMQLKQAKAAGLAVSGTTNAPPGSAVRLFVSTVETSVVPSNAFSAVVGDGGSWTATIPAATAAALTDGLYALYVQVLDAYGASSVYNSERLFTVDTQAPAQPAIPQLDPGSAAGLGHSGTPVTNTATPTIDGVAAPMSLVSLYAGVASGTPAAVASARADQNGVYSITAPHLADGIQDLEVQAVDPAGNPSPFSSSLEIIVDTTPPDPPPTPTLLYYSDSPDGPVTDVPRLSVIGTAEPNSDVTLIDAITGDVLATDVVVGADGTYAATTHELADGKYAVAAYATDPAGNVGKPSQYGVDVTIDTMAPDAPTIGSVSGGTASDGSLSPSLDVAGEAEPFSKITIQVDGAPDTSETTVTADEDGAFNLQTADLPAGAHTLTVTATDFAGNVSDVSAPKTVTISGTPILPTGTPPGAITINGVVIDGPIAGATVFADANGNGVKDPGEASGVTTTQGTFSLINPDGEVIATGGSDTETGLTPPGALTAPAGSVVIDPLTTLLDAYAAAVGETPQAAQPALLAILGLDPATDLTSTDPETAAAGGDPNLLIASAQVMDSAVVYAELVAAQTGVSTATAFAASFTALARQAATGALNLQDTSTTLVNLATAAAGIADPGFVLSNGLAMDAATILDDGNYDLSTASSQTDPSAALEQVVAIERVDQGQAAPQLAAASNDQTAASVLTGTYGYDLPAAVTAAETAVLPAPVLAPADDTGISAQDNVTSDTTPTFTGTAPPGATVILAVQVYDQTGLYSIVGSGIANAGGGYAVATTLPAGRNSVIAFEATPGEATAAGTQIYVSPVLTTAQITGVDVGDLPAESEESGAPVAPTIDEVDYTASSGNDATATSLYLKGTGSFDIDQGRFAEGAFYTVTANGNPVTEAPSQGADFGIVTTPLAAGTYSLVVTETALDGESVQSAPTTVTVTAPGSLSIQAEAAGPLAGGSIVGGYNGYEELVTAPDVQHPDATTDASGAASVPAQFRVPAQGTTQLFPTDAEGLELEGGQDAVTGLTLPINLSAPRGSSVITPATSLLNQADVDATPALTAATAADYAYENSRIDTALGLPTTVDLSNSDPLAMADAGNPALFLKDIELLDTIFLLIPFTRNGNGPTYAADPLYVIDNSLFILKFDDFIDGAAPAITTKPIDFTSAAEVLSWLTTYDSAPIGGSDDTQFDASVLPTVAAIIAASNAAIETRAAASTSVADEISYALAVERVALGGEEQALAALASTFNFPVSVAQQQAGFATLQADYTGSGLTSAVASALAQTVQVTAFTPASASTGAAREVFTITFSAPVGGVTAGDFNVSGSAGLAGAAVTAVTPVAGSDGAAYAVTVATGVGEGTLTLGFTPNGLTSADGSPLTTGAFAAPQSYSTPADESGGEETDPKGLAIGDFNGDGHADVLLVNDSPDGLTLFLGQSDGSLVAEPAVYTGANDFGPTQVVTGDFNGDGKLDAVTLGNPSSSDGVSVRASDVTVSALLGNGDGGFAAPVQTDVGPSADDIVTGDFNGDGKLDLAVLGATVQVFYGNGDGTFSAGPTTNVGLSLRQAVTNAVDLNGDGKPDLVIATHDNTTGAPGVAILLGNGEGGFTLAAQPALGLGGNNGYPGILIAVADLNGDGIPDIVVVPQTTGASESGVVLLGKGDGTFQPAATLALPATGGDADNVALAIGDVTGDGKPDIVVDSSESGVVIAPGKGDGTFGPAYFDAAAVDAVANYGGFPEPMALADVNGDGRLDLIGVSNGSEAGSSVTDGIAVSLGTAQAVLPASASVTVDRPAEAQPTLSKASGAGTLTNVGNAYSLNLGALSQGAAASVALALANMAAAPADSFDGVFSSPSGSGFTLTGANLSQAVAAGSLYTGLSVAADSSTLGAHSETITFAPRDVTDDPPVEIAVAADSDSPAATLPPADANGDDVALELAPLMLTINDDVVSGPAAGVLAISGTVANQPDRDEARIEPFATVNISDTGAGQTETVTVTPSAFANGQLSDPAGASDGSTLSAGVYTVSGTAAEVSADLQTLVFTPTAHQVAPGDTVTTSFTIAVSDTAGQTASDSTSSVVVTANDDGPVIGGISSPQTITATQTIQPFSGVTITDPDTGVTSSVTVTLVAEGSATDADGTLSGGSLTHTGAGTYVLQAASPAAAQALLQALVFTPASHAGTALTTTFDLKASDGTVSASDDATMVTVTASSSGSGAPTVALSLAHDTGRSATDAITSSGALIGSAGDNDTVTISNAGTVLGTVTANASGAYSFTPTGLSDGVYMLTATDSNEAGTGSATLAVTIDTTAPVVNSPDLAVAGNQGSSAIGIAASDNMSSNAQLSAMLTALPDDGTVSLDGQAVQTGEVLSGAQLTQLTFTPTPGLSNVSSTLAYTVTDLAGNATMGTATLGIGALAGSGAGDVHFVTFDGLHYDFQATGAFLVADAARAGADDGFAVQMRTEEWNLVPDTSVATELAARIGHDVVAFGVEGAPVTVNGASVPGFGIRSDTVQLGDGTLSQTGAETWLLAWNTGETLSVTNEGKYLNFAVTEGPQDGPGSLRGLLGSDTGQASDFQLPDGEVLSQPLSEATLLGQFADAWRVTAGDSLLDCSAVPPAATQPDDLAVIKTQAPPMAFLAPPTVTMATMPGAIWTGSLGSAAPVEIEGSSATLESGLLANLAAGDLIDIVDFAGATGRAAYGNGTVQAADSGHSLSIHVAGVVPGSGLTVTSDPNGGLLIHIL